MTHLAGQSASMFDRGGRCGALLSGIDWARHPLGIPAAWSTELVTGLGIVLEALQPMALIWGSRQIFLYNDAYAELLGARHPAALAGRYEDSLDHRWDAHKFLAAAAFGGIPTHEANVALPEDADGVTDVERNFSFTPMRDRAGRVLGVFCACTDVTESSWSKRVHKIERESLLRRFGVALGATAIFNGPDHVFAYANENYEELVGTRRLVGKTVADAFPETGRQGFIELLDHSYRTGEPFTASDIPDEMKDMPDRTGGRLVEFRYEALRDRVRGQVSGVMVQAVDITDVAAAKRQEELLHRELGHRLKNQLAVVRAIVKQSFRTAPDLETASRTLDARISALAAAHNAVIVGETGSTTVSSLIENVTAVLAGDAMERRFYLSGPDVILGEKAALSLGLIFHELSTNAVKYGALSAEAGTVRIDWRVRGPAFTLVWKEIGGPPVTVPTGEGFGSRLIRAGISGHASAGVTVEYAVDGLRCEIVAGIGILAEN